MGGLGFGKEFAHHDDDFFFFCGAGLCGGLDRNFSFTPLIKTLDRPIVDT